MKIKIVKLIFFTFVFFFALFVKSVNASAICTDTTGGCLGPEDNADYIGNGSTLAFCQAYQNDGGYTCTNPPAPTPAMCSGVIEYKRMGPRGDTCTKVDRFPGNGSCSCTNGTACGGGNFATSPIWDFKECAKCNNSAFLATWNQTAGSVTINASADNWRPTLYHVCILHCGGRSGEPLWDTHVRFPDSYLDFMFRVYESDNPTPIKEVQVVPNANPPTNMNCVYHTYDTVRGGGQSRSNLQHYVTCSISNYQITGLTFNPGKTYSIKTLIKAHYGDDTQWIDYVPVGIQTDKNFNICNSELTIPVLPTATPVPTGVLACDSLALSSASDAIPQLGDTLNFTCLKNASYTAATTYDFRLIHKPSGSDPDPNPLPTPFVENATSANASYQLPSGQYGYYLFQCRICSGAFCTDWQAPTSSGPTPTPNCIQPGRGCSIGSTPCCQIGNAYECLAGTCSLVGGPQP